MRLTLTLNRLTSRFQHHLCLWKTQRQCCTIAAQKHAPMGTFGWVYLLQCDEEDTTPGHTSSFFLS
eukprot:m.101392 g.101392  ORF g.101392 m.101392 type:complete len:66 (-) comp12508_c3_seq1:680-877(-)